MAYECKVIADSVGPNAARITTFQLRFPRLILAQFNTHRAISKNARSSRAVPVSKMIAEVENDPVVPIYWGKNQKGMAATRELTQLEAMTADGDWLGARDEVIQYVRSLVNLGVHKQIANRLLEPFMWADVVATATDWNNFFALRCDKHAQPEIQKIAVMMAKAFRDSVPARLGPGKWHLPFVSPGELAVLYEYREAAWNSDEGHEHQRAFEEEKRCLKLSVARCARVSYLTFDGKAPDPTKDIELHDVLEANGHWSPFEHQARANFYGNDFSGNLRGWTQYRQTLKKSVHKSFDFAILQEFGEREFLV